jgi:beta-1,4-mannosyltransferase
LIFVIGKGPLKEQFIEQVERERDQYQHVEFCFPWLDADDYPLLIGCADIGVSLHQSSSGFDLPMKVVDMFAVGVPVCSVQYDWYELENFQFK